jgi:hypothetical protein
VRAARRATCRLDDAERRRAVVRAWRESAFREAALRPSRLSAREVARDRLADGRFRPRVPARLAEAALRFVLRLALFGGAGSFTPERRAFERPIAIACFVDAAPCLPSRMWCISSRTNSPACVLAALPCCLSRRARLSVSFSGIQSLRGWRACSVPKIYRNVEPFNAIDICVG